MINNICSEYPRKWLTARYSETPARTKRGKEITETAKFSTLLLLKYLKKRKPWSEVVK